MGKPKGGWRRVLGRDVQRSGQNGTVRLQEAGRALLRKV